MSLDCRQYTGIPNKIKFEDKSSCRILKTYFAQGEFFQKKIILFKFAEVWFYVHKGLCFFAVSFLMFITKYCDNSRWLPLLK